jgi:hypothetical protein
MNTSRDKLENQIKKQINEREITPSRDLWSEIEMQTEKAPSKSRMSWVLAAACIILIFTLGFVLFFNSEKRNIQRPGIVSIKTKTPEKKISEDLTEKTQPVLADKKQEKIQDNTETAIKIKNEAVPEKVLAEKRLEAVKKETEPIIAPEILQVSAEKIVAQTDSSKIPEKKKKYVDPSTLLFSVEHKGVIEKTKESNVATIDLNGK